MGARRGLFRWLCQVSENGKSRRGPSTASLLREANSPLRMTLCLLYDNGVVNPFPALLLRPVKGKHDLLSGGQLVAGQIGNESA